MEGDKIFLTHMQAAGETSVTLKKKEQGKGEKTSAGRGRASSSIALSITGPLSQKGGYFLQHSGF